MAGWHLDTKMAQDIVAPINKRQYGAPLTLTIMA